MKSSNKKFIQFLDAVKERDIQEAFCLANQEATAVERRFIKSGAPDATTQSYLKQLKILMISLRFNSTPQFPDIEVQEIVNTIKARSRI